jgi:hypothetical protein
MPTVIAAGRGRALRQDLRKVVPFVPFTKLDGEAIKGKPSRGSHQGHARWTQAMRAIFGADNGSMIASARTRRLAAARLQLFCNTAPQFTHA